MNLLSFIPLVVEDASVSFPGKFQSVIYVEAITVPTSLIVVIAGRYIGIDRSTCRADMSSNIT